MTSSGSAGPGAVLSQAWVSSQSRTNCLSKLACGRPGSKAEASQKRDESGRQRLVDEQQVAGDRVDPELELGVGEQDAGRRGPLGGEPVELERVRADPPGNVSTDQPGHGLEVDVLVMLAELRLRGRGEDRFRGAGRSRAGRPATGSRRPCRLARYSFQPDPAR